MTDVISQKQAVVNATKEIMQEKYNAEEPVTATLTKDDILSIRLKVYEGIAAGDVAFNKDFPSDKLKKYVAGMVSNHFRKAKELNGNTSHKVKKQTVNTDKLSVLNNMLNTYDKETDEYKKISTKINDIELKNSTLDARRKYDIDVTLLSDDLKTFVCGTKQ